MSHVDIKIKCRFGPCESPSDLVFETLICDEWVYSGRVKGHHITLSGETGRVCDICRRIETGELSSDQSEKYPTEGWVSARMRYKISDAGNYLVQFPDSVVAEIPRQVLEKSRWGWHL